MDNLAITRLELVIDKLWDIVIQRFLHQSISNNCYIGGESATRKFLRIILVFACNASFSSWNRNLLTENFEKLKKNEGYP